MNVAADLARAMVKEPFPRSYIVDIAMTRDKGWAVVEFNALGTTGRYVNNRFDSIAAEFYGQEITMTFDEYCEFQQTVDQYACQK